MKFVSIILIFAALVFSKEALKPVRVVASGESHAMLSACDCPVEPGGGFSKRSFLLGRVRDTFDLLLVDAGGFAGGGIYDPYTEGRKIDSLRTMAAIVAMGKMKYDIACIGDDDLQYGLAWLLSQAKTNSLNLVSANCYTFDNKRATQPYSIVKKGTYSIGITGVTTQESLLAQSDSFVIKEPISSLKSIWNDLKKQSDFQIILAHVGEALSKQILDSFPECKLIVNGHRKNTTQEYNTKNGQVMLQFGFQGKSLSFADIVADGKVPAVGKTGWYAITPNIPDDPQIAKLTQINKDNKTADGKQVLDLYIMSQCPYGLPALKEMMGLIDAYPSLQWSVWFIGSVDSAGNFSSLHGPKEVNDELLWLSVQSLYPDKWLSFLKKRSATLQISTESILREMGLDLTKINDWKAKKGNAELRKHYERSIRMAIYSSPTLLINNTPYQLEIKKFRLSKTICETMSGQNAFCDSLPECETNEDCKMPGKTGYCKSVKGKKASCEFHEAPRFAVKVLIPDTSRFHPEIPIMSSIADEFPGALFDTVRIGSTAGKSMEKKFGPRFLPFFVFDKKIENTVGFSAFSSQISLLKSGYIFKDGMVKPSYFYNRQKKPNSLTIFTDPLFKGSRDALRMVLDKKEIRSKINIQPIIFEKPDTSISAEESIRHEEALRWLMIQKEFPEKYLEYLVLYCNRKNMSYWFTDCQKIGIPVDLLVQKIQQNPKELLSYWEETKNFGMLEPVEILWENREVIAVKNPKEFMDDLKMIR